MTSAASSVEIGASVGGYRLERLLGSGETGVVYLAEHGGEHVALRVLAPELARSARFRQRFIGDYQLLAEIDHPAVLPVDGAGEADGVLYVASRYVDGADLGTVLRDGPLPAEQAVGVVVQVTGALHAAHCCGLVHRDVKPSNIFIESSTHRAYLADFGLVGRTTEFAAPERIEGSRLDGRADVYSLGCVLGACVADPWVELTRVVAKARAADPEDRYTTALELAEACREALASRPVAVEAPAPPPKSRRNVVLAGVAVVIAAVAALALVLSLGGGHSRPAAVAPPPSPVTPKVAPGVVATMWAVARTLAAAPAQAPPQPPQPVYDVVADTGGVGVRYRYTPNHWCGGALPQTDPCWRDVVPGSGAAEGQQLRVYCYAAGTSVHGDAWWAKVRLSPVEYVPTTFLRSAARYSSIAPPTSLRC